MPQGLYQTQEQKLVQQQRLTQQQMLQVKLLEMPLAELEQNVRAEIDDNHALEAGSDDWRQESEEEEHTENDDDSDEREERQDALEDALQRLGRDDEMPEATPYGRTNQEADTEEIIYGAQTSFYDTLREQVGEMDLSKQERQVMDYLIGSLDSDGMLRKPLDDIRDELAVYDNIYVDVNDVEQVLARLQEIDPPGIGARSLQECLLLQINRRTPSLLTSMMRRVVTDYYDDFINKRWERIAHQLELPQEGMQLVQHEILRLNPKPGSALGETEGRSTQQVTPDFIVDTDDDGSVTFEISRGNVPELYVSPSFADMMEDYQRNRSGMNRQQKEALLYAREKVERARGYIEAVKQRRHTMYLTMKTIIELQRKYFQEGDENDLKPMVLKDVAERTGLDISTVSRVCNAKYAQTRWGTFRLRHFFSEGVQTADGVQTSIRQLKAILREIIDNEDKQQPLNDDALVAAMKEKGYNIARRTVSKYRGQMGIPTARLRKE